jgi:hypothetical protein
MRIFISYSHQQGDWVCKRLVPCLEAGGAEVLIDRERFKLGKAVIGQMDALQDSAERHLMVFSPDYLGSTYCQHEMQRALKLDPKFTRGLLLPVVRKSCTLPNPLPKHNPLYADLQDDTRPEPWDALLRECCAEDLGANATDWLAARDEIVRLLNRRQSVNLVTQGKANWSGLLAHIAKDHLPGLACVDLSDPDTMSRQGLLTTILRALGERALLPDKPHDLAGFKAVLNARAVSQVALTRFDLAPYMDYYDVDLFAALRFLVMENGRKLALLVQSRTAFGALLPRNHPLSEIDIKTVELRGKP